MKRFLFLVVVLAVAAGAVGYWRGWFTVGTGGGVDVHVDQAKFKEDKEAFTKTVSAKAKAMKDQVTTLWNNTEGLSGDDKAHAQKELGELQKKHDRIEKQIKELDDAGQDKFGSIRQDLSKNLDEVEQKIDEWTKKLEKGKEK